jgi:hypothetical protein
MRSVRRVRRELTSNDVDKRQAVLGELELLGGSKITDILQWDSSGNVYLTATEQLPDHVRRAIKKVKVTPNKDGQNSIEVEMHDKIAALRLLAKHHGLMEATDDSNRPSIIGINLHGPGAPVTTYKVEEKDEEDAG